MSNFFEVYQFIMRKKKFIKPLKFPAWATANNRNLSDGRYTLFKDGIKTEFDKGGLPYTNHIEFSGFMESTVLSYKISKNGQMKFYRYCVFPSMRTYPNNTYGSLFYVFKGVSFKINGKRDRAKSFFFNGVPAFYSVADDVDVTRRFFPGNSKKVLVEEITVNAKKPSLITFTIKKPIKIINKKYLISDKPFVLKTSVFYSSKRYDKNIFTEKISGKKTFYIAYSAEDITLNDVKKEIDSRENFISDSSKRLKITTPDETLNRMLEFTKIRASESIFQTKNGLMHAPGGGDYYAALWTNDECEYANPYFAYLGYDKANEQSLNCYRLYSKLAKKDKAIYTSIIAEGDDYWHGAGDRGDNSMYVYGFTRYLLTTGDKENALKYLPSLETACEYVMSKMNADNVIESDSDELENRFESGRANLSTAVISYDAFLSMSFLEKELGNEEKAKEYEEFSKIIKSGIHTYFEANVEGFETYRYCKEEDRLRSWICLPLTVGIFNRADDTIKALKSDKLKKPSGLLTSSNTKTYWDRSLLYALRGMFYAGRTNDALEMLSEYTFTRLLGEHVPYPIEAFPEGNAAHLSAESALYQRIFTEGVIGFRPLGFNTFSLKINLPDKWDTFKIENFNYADRLLTFFVLSKDGEIILEIPELDFKKIEKSGDTFTVSI